MKLPRLWHRQAIRVLMVCRANICRSPMAEALLRHKLKTAGMTASMRVASCGTRVSARGQPPDPRVTSVLAETGVPVKRKGARPIRARDFEGKDFILAMDEDTLQKLKEHCPRPLQHKLHLITDFSPELKGSEIPDPYYGNLAGFERVRDLLDNALQGFLEVTRTPPNR